MFGLYTPIVLLQAFCLYHAYRNSAEQRWYWFILFIPGLGCAFYLFDHFYNRNSINTITESVKGVVNNNYKIERLEKAFRFSDNHQNRVNLADAYVNYQRYDDAIKLYEESLIGFMSDDPDLRMKLLQANFHSNNYPQVIILGRDLESEKTFRNAVQRLAFAWALYYDGKTEEAEKVFMDMDKPFTNYQHRLEYCKFLLHTKRTDELKSKLANLLEEFEHVRGPERKLYSHIIREARDIYSAQTGK